jgi:subtilisin family serine protease
MEALEDRTLMSTTWGAQETLIGQNVASANYPTVTGAGTSIVIIDTGVDYNHPDLGAGFGPGHKVIAGWDFVDNDADPMDTDGHGTGVAALAAGLPYTFNGATFQGVAPGANIIALRIDDGTFGWNKESNLAIKALDWVAEHRDQYNIVAVNMSFGRGHYTEETDVGALQTQIATLASMGVFMAASSGNDGLQNGVPGIEYPAADPNVFAIGAVYPDGTLWSDTERSADMNLLAPGANITLPYYMPTTGQHIHLSGGYGTSFSTAFASGMGALLKQVDPTLTPNEMMSIMSRSGSPLFDSTTGLTWPRLSVSGAISMTYSERDDSHENNDSLATATALSFNDNTVAQNGLKLLQADADFFKFTLGERSDVDYALTLSGGTSPTVDLLDSHGTVLKRLSSSDQIRLLAGTYYLRVNAPATTLDGTYSLSLTKTPDDSLDNQTPQTAAPIELDASGQGSVSGMSLLGGADDYYSITLDATDDVKLTLDYAGASPAPTVDLLDANGNFIATLDGGTLSKRLNAGRYLLRVSSPDTLDGTYGLAVSAILYNPPPPPSPAGANGLANGIAYDAAGNLHMAYYDGATSNLKYARRAANGVWGATVTVDASQFAGQYLSLQLDSSGLPGIAYYDAHNADLKYAHFNGTTWDVMTVDSTHITGYYPSLRFDSLDRPDISYYAKTPGDLRFAAYYSGKWNLSTIDSTGDVGRYSSLAINPATGHWAMAYEDTSHGDFKYAEMGKNAWNVSFADRTTNIGGGYISLAFNPRTNRPAFSYYDAYNANLKFASFNGSAWVNQTVAAHGTVGLYSALTFNASGVADILYDNKGSDRVTRATQSGSIFNLTSITTDGGRWISRASTGARQTFAYLKGTTITLADL